MRKRPYLLKMGLAAALIGTSLTFNSCGGDGDDPQPTPQVKPNPDNPGGSTDNPGATPTSLILTIQEMTILLPTSRRLFWFRS